MMRPNPNNSHEMMGFPKTGASVLKELKALCKKNKETLRVEGTDENGLTLVTIDGTTFKAKVRL